MDLKKLILLGEEDEQVQSNQPPQSRNLISHTFKSAFNALYSPDKITASDEPAKFVSSFSAGNAAAAGGYATVNISDTTDWIVEFWHTPADLSTGGLVSPIFGNQGDGVYAAVGGAGWGGRFIYVDAAGNYKYGNSTFVVGTWYKFKISVVGGVIKLYVNDIEETLTGSGAAATLKNLYIGRNNSTNRLNGYIRDFKLWTGAGATTLTINYPCQGSLYDVSGNGNHATNTGLNLLMRNNDKSHYNLVYGFDKYSLDSAPTDVTKYKYIPYVSGAPVAATVALHTKISSHPASLFAHNGAETKVVVGTTGVKDANGWVAVADGVLKDKAGTTYDLIDADPSEIFIRQTTAPAGYCKEVDLNTIAAVSASDYVFVDKVNPLLMFNLLWYAGINSPINIQSVKAHKFINKTDFVIDELTGEYIFDDNNHVITEV